jgi:hypothetical protein
MPANPVRPASGQIIASDWGDSVADMVVRRYANAGARDADLGSHTAADLLGQMCVLTSTGELQQYAGPVQQWRPPWNLPWGVLPGSLVFSTLDVTGSASFQSILSTKPSVNLYAGRAYRITAIGTVICPSGNSQLDIQVNAGTYIGRIFGFSTTEGSFTMLAPFNQASSAIPMTIDFGIIGVNISSRGSMAPHRLLCEDVGPSASPTTLVVGDDGIERVDRSLLTPQEQDHWATMDGLWVPSEEAA